MPLGTQFGYSASGLASCVIRDLDASAPRPRLPPRALPDDVRERILRGKKKAEEVQAAAATIENDGTSSVLSSTKMSARAAARAEAEISLSQQVISSIVPKPQLIAKLIGAKAAAANSAAARAAAARRDAEAQSAVFGVPLAVRSGGEGGGDSRLSFGGETKTSVMRRSLGGANMKTVSVTAAAAPPPRRMKM